jgi:ElaB/YqjD/DUF883 family membrane-anchored ribosome-binding protein
MATFSETDYIVFKAIWDSKQLEAGLKKTTASVNKFAQALLPKKDRDKFIPFDEKQIAKASKQLETTQKKQVADQKNAMREAEQARMKMQRGFLQGGLSIMFFGMQMKKFFEGIAQSSMSTFLKLSTDTEMANNTMNRLNAGIEGVRFAIGDAINTALEPFEEIFRNVIDHVIDFVDEHPNLIAWAVAIGLIVGTVMMLVGQFSLLIIGISAAKFAFGGMGGAATTAGAVGVKGIMPLISKFVILIVAVLSLLAIFTGDETIRNWAVGAVKIIVSMISWVTKIVVRFVATLRAWIEVAGANFLWVFEKLGIYIQNIFAKVINTVIDGINFLIRQINRITGPLGLGKIGEITGKMQLKDPKTADVRRDARIQEAREKLAYYFSADFDNHLKNRVDAIGNWFGDVLANASQGYTTDVAAKQDLIEQEAQTVDKFDSAVNKFTSDTNLFDPAAILSQYGLSNLNTGGSTQSTYQNGQIFYGFSSTHTNQYT